MVEGEINKVEDAKVAVYSCPLDVTQTETKVGITNSYLLWWKLSSPIIVPDDAIEMQLNCTRVLSEPTFISLTAVSPLNIHIVTWSIGLAPTAAFPLSEYE